MSNISDSDPPTGRLLVDTTELCKDLAVMAGFIEDSRLRNKIYHAVRQLQQLREQVKYWNGIACEDRAEVERLRAIIRDGSGGYTAREMDAEQPKDANHERQSADQG